MGNTQVVTLDTNSLKEKVSNRIKETFADLIPEKAWTGLIDSQVKVFLEIDLPVLVKKELTDRYMIKLKEELDKPQYQGMWYNGKNTPGEAVKQIIKQCAPELIESLFGGVIQNAVMNMKNNMSRY